MKYIESLEGFADESKVWLYQADRAMTEAEMKEVESELIAYTGNWDSHGSLLVATAKVLNPYFAMIIVDQTKVGLCGGSVDGSTRFMKELGEKLKVNFFNRMNVTIEVEGTQKQIHFSELKNHPESLVYDSLITSLADLRKGWPRPVKESNFANIV